MSYARRDLSRITLTVTEPTMNGLRAHERRQGLVSPDRRCFVQSMQQDTGRRVGGNSVPNSATGGQMYSYTFPQQREQPNPYSVGPAVNYYSVQRGMQESQTRQSQRNGNGTPGRRSEYEPGAYSQSRSGTSVNTGSQQQPRLGTPTRTNYVDLERRGSTTQRR